MKKKALTLTSICAVCALGFTAQAQDVNLNFDQVTGDVAVARALDVPLTPGPSGVERYNFSDTSVFFNGDTLTLDQKFYGGFEFSRIGTPVTPNESGINQLRIRNDNSLNAIQMSTTNVGGGGERMRFMYVWDGADYGFTGKSFDGSSASSFSMSSPQNLQEGSLAPGGFNFVLRDSGTYYIANQGIGVGDNGFTDEGFSGDTAGLEWSAFDANDFVDYNPNDLSNIATSFSAQTFNNVEFVGLIGNSNRFSGAFAQISDFQVALVPEPSSYAFFAGMLAMVGVMIRRRAR